MMLMCGVGAKSVAHLMKFHLLKWEVVKVKLLMNSNMTLTVLNLHQKTNPNVQQDVKGHCHCDKVRGQIKVTPWCCRPTTPNQFLLPSINFLHLPVSEIQPGQDFKLKVTTARSKVKSRSRYDNAHLHPLTNVSTKYQLPTPYVFRDIALTRFYRSRSLQQGQTSNQGHCMTLHTYTP